MSDPAVLSVTLEPELRDRFLAAAAMAERSASDLLHDLVRDFVTAERDGQAYDDWFRAEVEQGLREADDPSVRQIPHEEIVEDWERRRRDLEARIGSGRG